MITDKNIFKLHDNPKTAELARRFTIYAERYRDFDDLLTKGAEPCAKMANHSRSVDASQQWDFGLGYKGAEKMVRDGWPEGARRIKHIAGRETDSGEHTDLTLVSAPFGIFGDTQAALHGDPEPYTTVELSADVRPILTLFASLSCRQGITAKAFAERGAGMLTAIQALEAFGYRVDLYAVLTSQDPDRSKSMFASTFKVKHSDQQINLPALAAVMAHPAMFRRIGFTIYERIAPTDFLTDYGYPTGNDDLLPVLQVMHPEVEQISLLPNLLMSMGNQLTCKDEAQSTIIYLQKTQAISDSTAQQILGQL